MTTDSNGDDLDLNEDANSSSGKSAASQLEELRRRFSGQSKTVDRLNKEVDKLRDLLSQKDSAAEEELSTFRNKVQTLEQQLKSKETELSSISILKDTAEQERDRLKAQSEAAKVIADKFPALLQDHLIGDLKARRDFESDEDFEAYLDRQAKKVTVPQGDTTDDAVAGKEGTSLADKMRGVTPSASTRIESGSKGVRSRTEIADEMMDLDSNDPKYKELFRELNEATQTK